MPPVDLLDSLVSAGAFLHHRGWVPATSGNLSVRDGDGFWITTSGRHKGHLGRGDFLRMGPDGPVGAGRPSAETAIHAGLYARHPTDAGAVLHTHSVHATVLSRLHPDGVVVHGHEIGKAFPGVETHDETLRIPVFPNDQDVPRLWARVDAEAEPRLPGFLIAGHGLYAWGRTVPDALRHVEAFEHLFTCVVLEATLRSAR